MSAPSGFQAARTLFLGSGEFAVPIATVLARHPLIDLVGVISAPERPGETGQQRPPIVHWALENRRPVLRPARLRDDATIRQVLGAGPELVVLADYGQIVPAALLDAPRRGALNIHPSLLPRHRGATPIPATILAGDQVTGVTIIRMDVGLDTGPIVAHRSVPLSGDEWAPELEARLAVIGADLLDETIAPWLAGQIHPTAQPAEGATLTRPLRREDGRLDPLLGVMHLDRQVRAYQPWPGTFLETVAGRIIVWDARPLPGGATRRPGVLLSLPANRVAMSTADGLLELIEVQPAGGRRMGAAELLRGRRVLVGSVVASPSAADDGA